MDEQKISYDHRGARWLEANTCPGSGSMDYNGTEEVPRPAAACTVCGMVWLVPDQFVSEPYRFPPHPQGKYLRAEQGERVLTILRAVDNIPGPRAPEPDDPGQSPATVISWEVIGPKDWIASLRSQREFPLASLDAEEAAAFSDWIAVWQGEDEDMRRAWGIAQPAGVSV
jgi:hypothetical protein